jgi:hypothetical protein
MAQLPIEGALSDLGGATAVNDFYILGRHAPQYRAWRLPFDFA